MASALRRLSSRCLQQLTLEADDGMAPLVPAVVPLCEERNAARLLANLDQLSDEQGALLAICWLGRTTVPGIRIRHLHEDGTKQESYLFCAISWRIPSMSSWMLYWWRAR